MGAENQDSAHSDESIAEKIEQSQYTRELTEWKSDMHTRLRLSTTRHNLFGYIIMKSMYMWSNSAIRVMLELLEQAARNYRKGLQYQQLLIG